VKRLHLIVGLIFALCAPVLAANPQMGPSGLPLPRFVSLKSDRVNVRQGPSADHKVAWTFVRAGLPVEITAEFDNWRRIRDSEGTEGWVQQGLLSGRRTALVAPWAKGKFFDLYAHGRDDAGVRAHIESGVLVSLKGCNGAFCRADAEKAEGYMKQNELWGVYENEKVE
jgi:SH3-like domain-containing protein